ncbi:MAG: hypothetical protein NDJ90_01210 [Oligoflexia bacterium]|nr:hypothetical protein [Oligoflexia bacterium]
MKTKRIALLHGLLSLSLLTTPAFAAEARDPAQLNATVATLQQMNEALEKIGPEPRSCTQVPHAEPIRLASEGTERGGGDIRRSDTDAAWFLGRSPIRTCLEIAPGFGPSAEEVARTLERAFTTWSDYIAEREVNLRRPEELQIHLNHELMPQCDGSEHLKFCFGVNTPETERIRKLYQNPTAFAHKTTYDTQTGRGKGFIWIAPPGSADPAQNVPDWTGKNHLFAQLLHELGHVAGTEHIEGTIMEADFSKRLFPHGSKGALSRIDGLKMLALPKDSFPNTKGGIGFPGENAEAAATFTKFTGRRPAGPVSAELLFSNEPKSQSTLILLLKDKKGVTKLALPMSRGGKRPVSTGFYSPLAVFKAVTRDQVQNEGTSGFIAIVQVKDARGRNFPATLEVNTTGGFGPVHVSFIENGEKKDLYNTFAWDWKAE